MKTMGLTVVASLVLAACAGTAGPTGSVATVPEPESSPPTTVTAATTALPRDEPTAPNPGSVRLLFAGDVMLGRRVGPVAAAEGAEFVESIRFVVSSADFAAANLESPLTDRPHIADTPNRLLASPELAPLLHRTGFDLMSVANNHATDAGREGLTDTLRALDTAGVIPLGGGPTAEAAAAPIVLTHDGIDVAFLAFDATHIALEATAAEAGVVGYEAAAAKRAVEAATRAADVVVVSVHGGVEYLMDRDPILSGIAADLVAWGADVVWGHGPHVPQPTSVAEGAFDRVAVIATSLGNFVFDQKQSPTQTGLLLEVLVGSGGVIAHRVGRAEHPDLRPAFVGWDLPAGDAVLIDGEWWSLARPPAVVARTNPAMTDFTMGDVTTAARGDATGDGRDELVVSYRHPFRSNPSNEALPQRDWTDASGRSAHLGVFEPGTMRPIWAAGTLLRPVADLAVCDGSVALAFDALDEPSIVATGAWIWWDFGFAVPDELPGGGRPGCADVDRDGSLDPVIVERGEQ